MKHNRFVLIFIVILTGSNLGFLQNNNIDINVNQTIQN